MKKLSLFVTGIGIWAVFLIAGLVFAADDPMSAVGILRIKTKLNAPDFVLQDVSGNRIGLREHQGQVVLLSFWTTW